MTSRTLIWTNHDSFSTEHAVVTETSDGWTIDGTAIAVFDDLPALVSYQINCDPAWLTTGVRIAIKHGQEERSVSITAIATAWTINGVVNDEVAGCTDIDLGITPFTNTLPIKRLNLAVGESAPASATWVQFPDLHIERLDQVYTRLSENVYRYESASGFTADLTVDDFGIVREYGDLWSLVSSYPPIG